MERVPESFSVIALRSAVFRRRTVQLFNRHALDFRKVVERFPNRFIDVEVCYENWDKELEPNTARGTV